MKAFTGRSVNTVPKLTPFFVKKHVWSIRFKQHPTVSPVVNVGPYGWPFPDEQKECPSSAW
jgi:hypothetical protein